MFPSSLVALAILATTSADLPAGVPISAPPTVVEPEPMGLGWGDVARAGDPSILFVNFDGAQLASGCGNNSKQDCSSMSFLFGGEIYPYAGGPGQRASLIQGVRADVADFGLTVTDTRPDPMFDYAMVLVGKSATGGSSEHGFAGVAPAIDCGNSNPNITSFDLTGSVTVINQEAAHTWGLEHVAEKSDNLYPTSGGVADPVYNDQCMKIVSDTMLNPSNGQCNSVHTMFCDAGWQNSYQEMLWLFGPGAPDAVAPEVTIDAPQDGAMLPFPASFDLIITLSDNQSPQIMDTVIYLDGGEAISGAYVAGTLKFPVQGGIAEGAHTWRVETSDEDGNMASVESSFVVGAGAGGTGSTTSGGATSDGSGGGSGGVDSTATGTSSAAGSTGGESGGGASTADEGCACAAPAGVPVGGRGWAALPLLLAARRRRAGARHEPR